MHQYFFQKSPGNSADAYNHFDSLSKNQLANMPTEIFDIDSGCDEKMANTARYILGLSSIRALSIKTSHQVMREKCLNFKK